MAPLIDLPDSALVAMTHDSLLTLRASMFRDLGSNAAALLQEAGYAGGQSMFNAFGKWLASAGRPSPESLPAAEFGLRAAEFFRATGWGTIQLGTLDMVATLDSANWAESDPAFPLEFPGCYYTAGVLADFFGRIAGQALAVMEVECRSMGGDRCRFLVGSGETMQRIYDDMGNGQSYEASVGTSTGSL